MKRLLVLLLILLFTLSACKPSNGVGSSLATTTQGTAQVDWVQINPPPGVEGPCFAYFHVIVSHAIDSSGVHSYSGVWCDN